MKKNKEKIIYIVIPALIVFICYVFTICEDSSFFFNKIISKDHPDQLTYHSIAVNYANGERFLTGGNILTDIDYKIEFSDERAKIEFNNLSGFYRPDRNPGYPLLLSLIYKVLGVNPSAIKILQFILFSVSIYCIPFIGKNIFNERGFYAGLLAIPFIWFSYINFAKIISPHIISMSFVIAVVYIYFIIRKSNPKLWLHIFIGLLCGLSFLFKPVLIFFVLFILFDYLFRIIKKNEKISRLLMFTISFLICWLPYNIHSIKKNKLEKSKASEILTTIYEDCDVHKINLQIKSYDFVLGLKTSEINIDEEDCQFYLKNIRRTYADNNYYKYFIYIDTAQIAGFNKNTVFLNMLEGFRAAPNYYLISLPYPKNRLLALHNEFTQNNDFYWEWINQAESFYNNDNLNHKSELYRVFNFYSKNPNRLLKNFHIKTFSYISVNNNLFLAFILFAALYILINLNREITASPKRFVFSIILVIPVLLSILYYQTIIYSFLFFLSMLAYKKFSNIQIDKSINFLILCIIIVPFLDYSNSRYLLYYDTYLFLLSTLIFVEIIYMLKEGLNSKTKNSQLLQ